MSVQSVALASLTATYTDSEGEEGVNDDYQENSNTPPTGSAPQNDQATGLSQEYASPKSVTSISNSPTNAFSFSGKSNNSLPNSTSTGMEKPSKFQRLVSYFDDTIVSDDEMNSAQTAEERLSLNGKQPVGIAKQQSPIRPADLVSDGEADTYGVIIPPNPPGMCPKELQDKINNYYMKMMAGQDMNRLIQNQKEFRNPSIYEKLIHFCNIKELGTNYTPDRFDPFKWSEKSYYDELAKIQKVEMEKLEKARKEKSKIEILSGTAKRPNTIATAPITEEDAKKRKSKWDQISTNPATTTTTTKPVIATQAPLTTLTSSVTGTRATVISAFGSLPKKRI